MLTGEIRSQIEGIWNDFWSGGVSNPLSVIEQITYLLFIKRLDELHTVEERKATQLKIEMERRIFPKGKDERGRRYEDLRWSRFKSFEPREMFTVVDEHVFPFLRTLGGEGSAFSQHMKDARLGIPTPALLATRAIRRVAEAVEKDHQRKALLVMATGAGKTRTVVALCDLLMRANWAMRVLFLADRVALVRQAVNAFKRHLPSSSPVNLVTEKDAQGRVYVSTYPTMMGLIDQTAEGKRRFGVGHFDLVVIDEAHRSIYRKYGAIFDYFDSLIVGLTATPKDEVDRDTYRLFNLQRGVPTDAYGLDEAVRDGFLVPPKAVSVPLRFQREGIRYDDLTEDDKEAWDAIEWDDEGNVPGQVESAAVNKWLFNADTVDKALEHLMTHGLKVAAGDRLGKTIIFAKNHDHAQFIAERFDSNYPHLKGSFARVIDFKTEYAQSLLDDFYQAEKAPYIAISVDM